MSKNEQQQGRWLQDKDGKVRLYAADDLTAAYANGMKEPDGVRGNGEPWNPEPIEGEVSQVDALAEVSKADAERRAKAAKRAEKDAKPEVAQDLSAALEAQGAVKVEIVEPAKAKKSAK